MEKFRIIKPSGILTPFIKHYWLLESDDVTNFQRIIPSGNIELVFHKGYQMICNGRKIPRTSVSGQNTSYSDLIPTGIVNMIVVVFHPFGAKAFFDIPISEFSEMNISVEEMNVKDLTELQDKIMTTEDDDKCIKLIESFLISRLNPYKEYNYRRMADTINIINLSAGEIRVSQLAEGVCLSNKQFQRIFKEHIGISPKEFIRIIRFHKALFTLQNNPTMNLTRLAFECGYYDQSHMINEFKIFSGYTPSEYVTICTPYSDYFS